MNLKFRIYLIPLASILNSIKPLLTLIKNSSLLIPMAFLACSCQNSGKELYSFNPETLEENEISLSEIADDISYIPLEDSILISGVNANTNPLFVNDRIYLYDRNQGILKFSRSGKFLGKIGNKGRGPGEYLYGHTYTADPNTGSVYLNDLNNHIKVYSHSGNYLRSILLDEYQGSIDVLDFFNDKLFVSFNFQFGENFKYEWVFLDTLGNIVAKKERSIPIFKSNFLVGGGTFHFNDNLNFWHNFTDTVTTFSGDLTYKPAFLLAQGAFRLPKQYVDDPLKMISDFISFEQILETNRFLILRYNFYNGKNSLVLIEKDKKKSFLSYYSFDDLNGLLNDLDGGIKFQPRGYLLEDGREYLIELKEALRIKAFSKSKEFENSANQNPEKKAAYKKMADSLRETANPVVMIVRLKD